MKTEAERLRKRVTNPKLVAKIKTGDVLFNDRKFDFAIKLYNEVLSTIDNSYEFDKCELYRKIGNIYYLQKDYDNARVYFEKTLRHCTTNASIFSILAYLYFNLDNDKSIEYYTKAIALNPKDEPALASKCLAILKSDKYSQKEIKEIIEKDISNYRNIIMNGETQYTYNDINILCRIKKKKLHIGYLSSDLSCHAMMQFMLPVFEYHNLKNFDITLYSTSNKQDYVTDRIKNTGMQFVNCYNLTHKQLAQKIHDDNIDILIDIGGYTHCRSFALFYKPAPIIMQYLGFVNTMGMKEVDYILCDEFTVPSDKANLYTEKPLYIDKNMQRFCFSNQNIILPNITELPYNKNGYITFGSFNCTSKINNYTIKLWSDLLKFVDNSKLLIYRTQMTDTIIKNLKEKFNKNGIDNSRLIIDNTPQKRIHFEAYSKADIALDTIPFNGLTITIEEITMGVPVITLVGEAMQSRGCARINKALNLDDLIAENEEQYIKKANRLACDINKLRYYRKNLRNMLFKSYIMKDYKGFVKNLEDTYISVWNEFAKIDSTQKKSTFDFPLLKTLFRG